ncbi:MAG: thiamine-phosphate kinase [Dehalococcoidia bacterium]
MPVDDHRLQDLGEFALIDRIIARLGDAAARDIVVPPGDDAAAWTTGEGLAIATIDALVEGTHFRRDTMSMADAGWRSVAANISDLAAMGAEPQYLLIATLLGPDATLEDVDGLAQGITEACLAHGVRVAGGDIVRASSTGLSIAAFGHVPAPAGEAPALLRRDGARAGDRVAASGYLGAAAAGLALIEAGRGDDPRAVELVRAHRRPLGRVALGRAATARGVRCGIDCSDGLLQDLGHVAERSGVGIEVDVAQVPLHPAAIELLGAEAALDLALGGGEDFELLLTGAGEALASLSTPELPVSIVGRVVAEHPGEVIARRADGARYEPPSRGWDQTRNAGDR